MWKPLDIELDRARANRELIKQGIGNSYYLDQEARLRGTPFELPLSKNIAQGELKEVKLHHIYAQGWVHPFYSWARLYKREGGRLYGMDGTVKIIRGT